MHMIVSFYDIDNRADMMTLWFIRNVFNIHQRNGYILFSIVMKHTCTLMHWSIANVVVGQIPGLYNYYTWKAPLSSMKLIKLMYLLHKNIFNKLHECSYLLYISIHFLIIFMVSSKIASLYYITLFVHKRYILLTNTKKIPLIKVAFPPVKS